MINWPHAQLMYVPMQQMPPTIGRYRFFSDEADSDADFDTMEERRSLMTLRRRDKIKVIEFIDPLNLTACRLSQLADEKLRMMCFLISPTLCIKMVSELNVSTMAGFKRMMSAAAIDHGLMSRLVKSDLSNLFELASESGWTPSFGVPDFNCEVDRVPRGRKRRVLRNVTSADSALPTRDHQAVHVPPVNDLRAVRRRLRSKSAPPA